MDASTRAALIAKYREGCQVVAEALAGYSEDSLDGRPAPGKWSAREIVHHLADSEMIAAIRLRRLLAEDKAMLQAFDQKLYAGRLFYDRPIQASFDAFRAARQSTAEILERMTEAQWRRAGTHSEMGHISPEKWLTIYAHHAHTHAEQIRNARSAAQAA
jgi:hypothetical protein